MAHNGTVLGQFLKLVSRHEFEREAVRHHRGRKLRSMSRWSQFSDDLVIDDRFRFRVFAYNDRGYSVGSPSVQEPPFFRGLTATAGDGEVRLGWRRYSAETVTGIQSYALEGHGRPAVR